MQIYFLALIKLSKTSWKVKNKQTNIVVKLKLKLSYFIQDVKLVDNKMGNDTLPHVKSRSIIRRSDDEYQAQHKDQNHAFNSILYLSAISRRDVMDTTDF